MKKKSIVGLIVLTLTLFLTGCGTPYADGVYTGTSMAGMHGEFAVEITVEKGKISKIEAPVNNETEGIGKKVVDQLFAQVLEKQSAEIDAVSGASKTSAAVLEAVTKALEKAGK